MKRILFIFVIFSSIEVMCQISESDTSSILLNLGANGTYISGNVERLLVMPNLDVIIQNSNLSLFTSNRYQYGTIGNNTTESDLLSRNFIYFFPKSEVYTYIMGWVETNKRKKFDFRFQIGPGVTYKLLNEKDQQVKLSLTYSFEQTDYNSIIPIVYRNRAGNTDNQRITIRLAGNNVIIDKLININYEFWLQESIIYKEDRRFYLNTNFDLQLINNLKFRTSMILNNESIVVPNVKNTDLIITFGFSYLLKN